jgi:hypothetical protein
VVVVVQMRESGAEVALAQLLLDYGDDLSSLTPSAVKAVTAQYDVEYATHLTLVARMYTDYLLAMLNWPDVRCSYMYICRQYAGRGVGAKSSRRHWRLGTVYMACLMPCIEAVVFGGAVYSSTEDACPHAWRACWLYVLCVEQVRMQEPSSLIDLSSALGLDSTTIGDAHCAAAEEVRGDPGRKKTSLQGRAYSHV